MFNSYNPYGGSVYQPPFSTRPVAGQPNSYQNMAGTAFQPNQQYLPYQGQPQVAQQPIQQQMPQQPVMHVRAVTGLEEARAAQIDFDGSIYVFPDLGNGKIYIKQFSFQTGAANFQTYKVEEPLKDNAAETTAEKQPSVEFTPLEDFKALKEDVESIKTSLANQQPVLPPEPQPQPTKGGKQ